MRIFSVLLLLAAGLFLLPPGTGAAGFVGPGVSPTLTRAADVLNAWDDAPLCSGRPYPGKDPPQGPLPF